jgi:hypothetical protein
MEGQKMDIDNPKALAREAAKSDFLWELGMRAPSANQVREFCKKWSVALPDEKRIKAVMRLREADPQALLEIRNVAADEGDEEMVEVKFGQPHYDLILRKNGRELWRKIKDDLGLSDMEGAEEFPIIRVLGYRVLYVVPESGSTFCYFREPRFKKYAWWRTAVVNVDDKRFLAIGKKIARAYEAETRRRRKPAKAVVLKNY